MLFHFIARYGIFSMSVRGENQTVTVFTPGLSGHRESYLSFVTSILPSKRGGFWSILFGRGPSFFLMIEDSFLFFVVAAYARALIGRRTVGILMRPKPALEGTSLRLRTKKWLLSRLRRIEQIRVLTILPFTVRSDFEDLAASWIYDFQLWDLDIAAAHGTDLAGRPSADIEGLRQDDRARDGRSVVISAVGTQNRGKGYDLFAADLGKVAAAQENPVKLLAAGRVSDELKSFSETLKTFGGTVLDRRISDDELICIYQVSDLIWACYSPDYDQASGIMGRAVQLGIPVIVRSGSLSHALCETEGLAHVAVTHDTLDRVFAAVPRRDPQAGQTAACRFREVSMRRLREALGLQPVEEGQSS